MPLSQRELLDLVALHQENLRAVQFTGNALACELQERATPATVQKPKVTPTPPMPKQPLYKGDTGLFRKALWECGWFSTASDLMFHDKRKCWSRIKLWFGERLYEATQAEQQALEAELRKAFGDRIIKMGFIKHWQFGKSFCVWLKP